MNVPPDDRTAGCFGCHIELDAIPEEEEKGYGEFFCEYCNHKWTSPKAEWNVGQFCFHCQAEVFPSSVGPKEFRPRTRKKHSCENCHNGACNIWPVSNIVGYTY